MKLPIKISSLQKKYLEHNVFKTLTPDISVPYWGNITPSSIYSGGKNNKYTI